MPGVALVTNFTAVTGNQATAEARRALRCILGDVNYEESCSTLGLITLADRREQLTKHFFEQLAHPDSCLTHLMPPKRDLSIHLRRTRLYELPKTRRARYAKSFLQYCFYSFT